MNINCLYNNLNFGKTLIRKADAKSHDGSIGKVNVVEYDPNNQEDREQILSQGIRWAGRHGDKAWAGCEIAYWFFTHTPLWFKERICPEACNKFECHDNYRFFGLENKDGDILALGSISEGQSSAEVAFVQTDPKEMYGSKTRSYKYLGQTLVSELVRVIRKNPDCKCIEVNSANDDFWDSSRLFDHEEDDPEYLLPSNRFSKYIKFVKDRINS